VKKICLSLLWLGLARSSVLNNIYEQSWLIIFKIRIMI